MNATVLSLSPGQASGHATVLSAPDVGVRLETCRRRGAGPAGTYGHRGGLSWPLDGSGKRQPAPSTGVSRV